MFVAIACEPSAKLPVANCRLAEEGCTESGMRRRHRGLNWWRVFFGVTARSHATVSRRSLVVIVRNVYEVFASACHQTLAEFSGCRQMLCCVFGAIPFLRSALLPAIRPQAKGRTAALLAARLGRFFTLGASHAQGPARASSLGGGTRHLWVIFGTLGAVCNPDVRVHLALAPGDPSLQTGSARDASHGAGRREAQPCADLDVLSRGWLRQGSVGTYLVASGERLNLRF